MIWLGAVLAWRVRRRRMVMSVMLPLPWWPWIGMLLMRVMSIVEPLAGGVWGGVGRGGVGGGGVQAGGGEVFEGGEDAAVGVAGLDLPAGALVEGEVRVGEDPVLE